MQRISREQLIDGRGSARADFLRALDEAGEDGAKLALAQQKLAWSEEALMEAFNQRSSLFRFFDSIPVLGKPVAIILDHLEKGIAEHGLVLGLFRGGLMGLVLAVMLSGLSETILAVHKVWGNWIELVYVAPAISGQRVDIIEESRRNTVEQFVHRGVFVAASQNIAFYAPEHADPFSSDGLDNITIDEILRTDRDVFKREPNVLDKRILIVPFFRHHPKKKSILPGMSQAAHHDLVTLTDPATKIEYALVGLDEQALLVPMAAYSAAGLPVSEPVLSEQDEKEKDARSFVEKIPTPQVLDIIHAETVSSDVPFVGAFETGWRYRDALKSTDLQEQLKPRTMWFHHDGLSQPERLPVGTRYEPHFKKLGDPSSFVAVDSWDGRDEKFILATVRIKDAYHPDGDYNYGLIPKAEYDLYVKGLK